MASSLVVAFGVLSIAPSLAYAQSDADTTLQRVEVTGSRIKRAASEGALPVTVITRENLEASGAVTVAEFVRNSTFSTSGNFRPQSGSSAQSFSEISLRGLGSRRTLVLIDGRRVAKSPTVGDAVDMNSIPMAAVERIEILTDGASAIYGSDAIGGVVNIIMRKDYEGIQVMAGKTKTSITGGDRDEASVLMGVHGEKGSIIAGASHTKRDIVYVRDYPWGAAKGASSYSNNYFTNAGTPGDPYGGSFIAAVPGGCTNTNFYSNSRCRYNFNAVAADEAATSADSFFARGEVKINDDWSAYMNSSVTRSQSFGRYAPTPGDVFIAKGSLGDYLSSSGQGALVPAGGMDLMHRFAAAGTRDTSTDNNLYDIAIGAKGRVGKVDTEFGTRYTTSKYVETGRGFIVRPLAEAAINNGTYNLLDPASTPLAVLKGITGTTGRDGTFTQSEVYGNAQVDLFKMGGGSAILFVGAEHRKETYADVYDSLSEAGLIMGSSGNSAGGGRTVDEIGTELMMPITKQLEASLSGRYVKYSDYGNDFSPKASLRWQPTKTVTLRTSIGKGFAAPSLPALTQKPAFSADSVIDLRHCKVDDPTNSAAYCAENSYQINGLVISNPALTSEKSDQFSLGGAWDVTPMLTVKADYWKTTINDVIVNIDAQTIVNRDNGDDPLAIPAGLSITRAANGSITQIVRGATNEGVLKLQGLDMGVTFGSYSLAGRGKARHELTWSHIISGTSNGVNFSGEFENPKDRAVLSNTFTMGEFETTWNVNMIGSHGTDSLAVSQYITHDLQFAWKPSKMKGSKIAIGAVNATDKYPELISNSSKPFSYNLYDMYGRQIYVRGEFKF
jgi:iron complex outermembrane receptor protein